MKKQKYAIVIADPRNERIIYEGAIHTNHIGNFMRTLMNRGLMLVHHYKLDDDCQPKIINVGAFEHEK